MLVGQLVPLLMTEEMVGVSEPMLQHQPATQMMHMYMAMFSNYELMPAYIPVESKTFKPSAAN